MLRCPEAAKIARVEHHAAVPVDGVQEFMMRLRTQEGMGARALEFLILTAARSGEVRGATWSEIDLSTAVHEGRAVRHDADGGSAPD